MFFSLLQGWRGIQTKKRMKITWRQMKKKYPKTSKITDEEILNRAKKNVDAAISHNKCQQNQIVIKNIVMSSWLCVFHFYAMTWLYLVSHSVSHCYWLYFSPFFNHNMWCSVCSFACVATHMRQLLATINLWIRCLCVCVCCERKNDRDTEHKHQTAQNILDVWSALMR